MQQSKDKSYPHEIIQYAVYLHYRFTISLRDLKEMLFDRDIVVCYETIRECGLNFDQHYANSIKERASRRRDKWYLDQMCIAINQ